MHRNSGKTTSNIATFLAIQQKAEILIFQRKRIEILNNKSIPVFDKVCHKGKHMTSCFGITVTTR